MNQTRSNFRYRVHREFADASNQSVSRPVTFPPLRDFIALVRTSSKHLWKVGWHGKILLPRGRYVRTYVPYTGVNCFYTGDEAVPARFIRFPMSSPTVSFIPLHGRLISSSLLVRGCHAFSKTLSLSLSLSPLATRCYSKRSGSHHGKKPFSPSAIVVASRNGKKREKVCQIKTRKGKLIYSGI